MTAEEPWCVCTVEHHSAIKSKEILTGATGKSPENMLFIPISVTDSLYLATKDTKAKQVVIAPEAQLTEEVVGVKPVHAKLGPAFKAQAKAIVSAVAAMAPADAAAALAGGAIEIDIDGEKVSVGAEYFELDKRLMLDGKAVETIQVGNVLILIEL